MHMRYNRGGSKASRHFHTINALVWNDSVKFGVTRLLEVFVFISNSDVNSLRRRLGNMPRAYTRVRSAVSSLLLKSICLYKSINLMKTLYALLVRTFALGYFYGCLGWLQRCLEDSVYSPIFQCMFSAMKPLL